MIRPGRTTLILVALIALVGGGLGFLAGSGGSKHVLAREASGIEAPFVELAGGAIPPTPGGFGPLSAPLYVDILARLGIAAKDGIPAVRVRQAVLLGALLPASAALAAALAFGAAAVIPAGLVALLPGALWIQLGQLVPFGWQALAAMIALVALIGIPARAWPGGLRGFIAGLALTVARLLGAAWAPAFMVVTAAWLLARRRFAALAPFAAAALLIFVLPGVMNEGREKPIATAPFGLGGIDAWSGFHDGATGLDPRRGESGRWRWETIRDKALEMERRLKHRVSRQDVVNEGYARARRWAVAHPAAALVLVARKSFLALSGYDAPAPESLVFRARELLPWSRPLLPLAALVLGFGLTGLVLALFARPPVGAPPGAEATIENAAPPAAHDAARAAPFALLLVATLGAAALSVVRAGDRLPLLVAMAAPAGYALVRLKDATSRGRLRLLAALVGLPLVLSLPWLLVAPRAESGAEDHFLLASIQARGGPNAQVTAELESALRHDPTHVGARMALASALAQDGLYDEALSEITRVTEETPGLSAAWHFRALLHQQRSQYEEARAAYETLTTLNPLNPEYWNNLGTLQVTLGAYEPAVAALKQALVVDSTYTTARRNLEEVVRRGPEGIRGGIPSTGGTPVNGMTQIQQGVAAVMQSLQAGKVADADRIVSDLRSAFGSTPDIDFAAGTVHLQKGELAPAIELYERCRAAMPGNPVLLNNLAAAYARSGHPEKSIPLWEEILKSDPGNAMVRGNIEAARRELSGR